MTYYDAEIEYLETTSYNGSSNGTQYIDIGIKGSSSTSFDMDMYIPTWNNDKGLWLFGARTALGNKEYGIYINPRNGSGYWRFNTSKDISSAFTAGRYNLNNTTNPASLKINNNTAATISTSAWEGEYNIVIFGINLAGSIALGNNQIGTRLYSAKWYTSGNLIRDFIPVRVGQVGYLYDKVSDTLFGNAGTGSFTLGPDVKVTAPIVCKPKVSSIRRLMILLMPKHDSKYQYIQDGLIFQLDGINKGTNEGAWTDLVGGHIYTNYGATALENGWRLYNKDLRSVDYNFLSANSNQTVEIVFKPTVNSGPQAVWMQNGNQNMTTNTVLLFWNGTAVTFLQHNKTYTIPLTVNAYHCVSLNLTLGLVNGVKKNPNTTTDYWNHTSQYSSIGSRNGGAAYFKGDIFAIRVYDRRLTEDEMLHNQQVDNIRFHLGLNI